MASDLSYSVENGTIARLDSLASGSCNALQRYAVIVVRLAAGDSMAGEREGCLLGILPSPCLRLERHADAEGPLVEIHLVGRPLGA